MTDWEALVRALDASEEPQTAEGLAEILWLARNLPARGATATGAAEEAGEDDSATRSAPALPAGISLPRSVSLRRSLLPLRRSVPSRTKTEIDEEVTANTIAESGIGIWVPTLRPASERWLDVALIADGGASMIVWQSWISSVTRLLERAGVFRNVRVWSLDTDQSPLLRQRAGGPPRRPAELMDPKARQIFLVLSDCVGRSWRDGSMSRTLEMWARSGTVTIVQPLAERMWKRCGPEFTRARITPRPAGAAVTGPYVVSAESGPARPGLPVLVIQLVPDWLDWWASLISGRAVGTRSAAVLFTGAAVRTESAAPSAIEPRDLVGRFRSSASPLAFELAVQMSVVPLNLATMLFVLSLTSHARELHLAEVLLGGLLRRAGANSPRGIASSDVGYDFRPGVRELLLSYMATEDVISVLGATGSYLHANLDTPWDLNVVTPLGEVPVPSESFAIIAAQVLQSLDSPYADAAAGLRSEARFREAAHP